MNQTFALIHVSADKPAVVELVEFVRIAGSPATPAFPEVCVHAHMLPSVPPDRQRHAGCEDGNRYHSKMDRRDDLVFALGDTHGNTSWLHRAFKKAAEIGCRRIVQLGDFGFWTHRRSGVQFLDDAQRYCDTYNIDLVWIDGNHEAHHLLTDEVRDNTRDDGFVAVRPRVLYAPRGLRWEWSGVRFAALGGAFSVDWKARVPGESWWPEESITEADVERLGTAPVDVLVAHDAPHGVTGLRGIGGLSPETQYQADLSRGLLTHAMQATCPQLLLHGHWHYRNSETVAWPDPVASEDTGEIVWRSCQVEGLSHDGDRLRDHRSWGVLHLPSLRFHDGEWVERSGGSRSVVW